MRRPKNTTVVVALPVGSDVHEGDTLRFVQAPTEDAAREPGATTAVMRVLREPHPLPGGQHVGVPVEMLEERDEVEATVVVEAETKRHG